MALCEQIVSIDVNVHIERVVASISDTELLDMVLCQDLVQVKMRNFSHF